MITVSFQIFKEMKHIRHFFPIVFILMTSCSSQPPTGRITKIDIEQAFHKNADIFLSDFAEKIEYIPLETLRECVIGHTLRVFATDDYIVAIAFRQNYLFDRKTGKFIREIGRFGNGPNEYMATNFVMPFDENRLTVQCLNPQYNETVYDLEGNVNRTISRPEEDSNRAVSLDENLFVTYKQNDTGNEPDKLLIFDEKGNIHKRFPNYHSYIRVPSEGSTFSGCVFYKWKNHVFFYEDCVDTLFQVTIDEIISRYHFHLGKYHPPYSEKQNLPWPFGDPMYHNFFRFQTINETERFLFFSFRHRKGKNHRLGNNISCHFFGFYDKALWITKISEVDQLEKTPVINDIDDFAPLYPFFWSINQSEEMVAYMEAGDIEEWFKENPEKAKKIPDHLKRFSKLTSEDNPVVVIAKLKQ